MIQSIKQILFPDIFSNRLIGFIMELYQSTTNLNHICKKENRVAINFQSKQENNLESGLLKTQRKTDTPLSLRPLNLSLPFGQNMLYYNIIMNSRKQILLALFIYPPLDLRPGE